MKKDEQLYGVKIILANGTSIVLDPSSQKDADATAKSIIQTGCEKDGTYYPVHQITRVKVFEAEKKD